MYLNCICIMGIVEIRSLFFSVCDFLGNVCKTKSQLSTCGKKENWN